MKALYLACVLIFLTSTTYGGIKKAETKETTNTSKDISDIKNIYKENGSLDLNVILDLPQDTKIAFKLNNKIYPAIITKVEITKERIIVAGKLLQEEQAGFLFVGAPLTSTIGGVVYFIKQNTNFVLKYNQEKELFYLEEKKMYLESDNSVFEN